MSQYKVVPAPALDAHILRHVEFLARVSIPAVKRFRAELKDVLHRLEENPYQFPAYDDPNLPKGVYRKALFAKWYKAVFTVEGETVYLDAIVDGRMNYPEH